MRKIASWVVFVLLICPWIAYGDNAQDIFQVKTPNVMIIFDTSSSMECQPNGLTQAAGNMCIKNDGSGTAVAPDSKGNCSSGYTKYYFDTGGNHPNSKLYQAKQALNNIITTVVKDQVNLGFSTYAQFKTEKRTGKYSYTIPGVKKASKLYWTYYKTYSSSSNTSFQSNSFTDAWGVLHTNVSVNSTFTRAVNVYNSSVAVPPHPPAQTLINLKYTVTSIVYSPEYNWYTFSYKSDLYDTYSETTYSITGCTDCSTDTVGNPFPATEPPSPSKDSAGNFIIYRTYFSGDNEYSHPSGGRNWKCTTSSTGDTTGYTWRTSASGQTFCDASYTSSGTTYTLVNGTCYESSDYSYPSDGTTNKPHTWSYFKGTPTTGNPTKWPDSGETPNYYPSMNGGNINNSPGTLSNHYFFTNFPDDKATNFSQADRTTIMNQVKSFLDLTPVLNPYNSYYWTKLPLHGTYGRTGLTSNTTASIYTPLADSLADTNRYFTDYINTYNGGDPSSKEQFAPGSYCRGNYVILLTDGLESARCTGNKACPSDGSGAVDYAAAPTEAAKLLTINVKTFVIGFGTDLTGNTTLNNIAQSGGTQKAYFAANLNQLTTALQSIFQVITGEYYGRSNPVVTRARNRLFRGNFDITDLGWRGHLMAWDADPATGVLAPTLAWDAGDVLKQRDVVVEPRNIYTWIGGSPNPTRIDFNTGQSSLYSYVNPNNEDINGDGKKDATDATTVVNFTLDPNYNDGTNGAGYYKGNRVATWKLGDVYHSTPVVIAEPSFFFTDNNYADFYQQNIDREMLIYVGTNDGMLHAFRNSDGGEKFSIIPRNLLGKLKNLRTAHDYYVDSSPKAYDVYFKGKLTWQTVLVTGERGGGPYYIAVNVNNPNDPQILWEFTDPGLGDTWAKPDIGKITVGGQTKYVAFLTGGYSTTDNVGNSFYIVDIETGCSINKTNKGNCSSAPTAPIFTVGDSKNKIEAGPTAFDSNSDGYIESVYFGDANGTLWKIDVSDSDTTNWNLYQFFTPQPSRKQPIYYSPAVTKNDLGQILIYFGTGNEMNLLDAVSKNYFYEILDQGTTGKENWRQDLDNGEKILSSPAVSNWVVYFTTWLYQANSAFCGAGEGRLWGLKVSSSTQTGGAAGLVTLDTSTGKWNNAVNFVSLGAGIPSAPLVTNGMVYIGTSLNANKVIQIPVPPMAKAQIKSWREVTTGK
jgi:hypothetical protein